MKVYTYRSAQPSDTEAIVLLTDQAESARRGHPIPTQFFEEAVVERTKKLIGEASTWSRLVFDGDKLVGCALGYPAIEVETGQIIHGREHLDGLMVDPKYWGKGIGGNLLDWVVKELSAKGFKGVDLWTETDNVRSRPLYERKGYHITGVERTHPKSGEHQVQYLLAL